MKKILIICDYYAPQNKVAALRPTKIAKFLKKDGFIVDVLTRELSVIDDRDPSSLKDIVDIDNILRIADSGLAKWNNSLVHRARSRRVSVEVGSQPKQLAVAPKPTAFKHFIGCLSGTVKELLIISVSRSFARRSLRKLSEIDQSKPYDVIFSTYGEFSGHLAALKYKKKHPEVLWIADFRDPIIQEKTGFLRSLYAQTFQKNILKNADVIIAISQGVLESLNVGSKPSYVISNGYDRDDFPMIQNAENLTSDDKFTLSFCGQLTSGWIDFGLVFQALSELAAEGRLLLEFVGVEYAGKSSQMFFSQAAEHGLEKIIKSHGFIPREEALKIQARSHVLLLASMNTSKHTGVITGKFYEQILMRKPIICTVTGELPNSALKAMIEEGKLGVCCEHAGGKADYLLLKEYIFTLYDQYRNNGTIHHHPDEDYVARFDYANITRELEKVFSS